MLQRERFEAAARFLRANAQDIDLAMFEYYFEGKPKSKVLEVLARYQNEDGGFGTLDYDFEFPKSCGKQTESACRYLYALDIPPSHPMIQKLIAYLVANYNPQTGRWDNLTVPEVNDYPHAPWWAHREETEEIPKDRAELVRQYDPNTHSALAGMVVKYRSLAPEGLAEQIAGVVTEKINSGYGFGQYGMLSDLYFVSALEGGEKEKLLKTLMGDGRLISILDEPWSTENAYKLCQWIDSPAHPYYGMYREAVEGNLDFLVESQSGDGSWSPSWRWGSPEVWERVEKRLKGLLTVTFLRGLDRFGRIVKE